MCTHENRELDFKNSLTDKRLIGMTSKFYWTVLVAIDDGKEVEIHSDKSNKKKSTNSMRKDSWRRYKNEA